jgi:hypothetical protein
VTLERYTLRWTGTARPPGFSGGWPRTHNQPATPASNSRPPGVFPRCHQPKQILSSGLCGPAKRTPVRAACMNARDLMRQAWHSSASVSNQAGCIWLGVLLARAVGPGLALVAGGAGSWGSGQRRAAIRRAATLWLRAVTGDITANNYMTSSSPSPTSMTTPVIAQQRAVAAAAAVSAFQRQPVTHRPPGRGRR